MRVASRRLSHYTTDARSRDQRGSDNIDNLSATRHTRRWRTTIPSAKGDVMSVSDQMVEQSAQAALLDNRAAAKRAAALLASQRAQMARMGRAQVILESWERQMLVTARQRAAVATQRGPLLGGSAKRGAAGVVSSSVARREAYVWAMSGAYNPYAAQKRALASDALTTQYRQAVANVVRAYVAERTAARNYQLLRHNDVHSVVRATEAWRAHRDPQTGIVGWHEYLSLPSRKAEGAGGMASGTDVMHHARNLAAQRRAWSDPTSELADRPSYRRRYRSAATVSALPAPRLFRALDRARRHDATTALTAAAQDALLSATARWTKGAITRRDLSVTEVDRATVALIVALSETIESPRRQRLAAYLARNVDPMSEQKRDAEKRKGEGKTLSPAERRALTADRIGAMERVLVTRYDAPLLARIAERDAEHARLLQSVDAEIAEAPTTPVKRTRAERVAERRASMTPAEKRAQRERDAARKQAKRAASRLATHGGDSASIAAMLASA